MFLLCFPRFFHPGDPDNPDKPMWALLFYTVGRTGNEPDILWAENMLMFVIGFRLFSSTGSAKQILGPPNLAFVSTGSAKQIL